MNSHIQYKRKGANYYVGQTGELAGLLITTDNIPPPRRKMSWARLDGEIEPAVRIRAVRNFPKSEGSIPQYGACYLQIPKSEIKNVIKELKRHL